MQPIKTIEKSDSAGGLFYLYLYHDQYFNITSLMYDKEYQWADGFIDTPLTDSELANILINFIEGIE